MTGAPARHPAIGDPLGSVVEAERRRALAEAPAALAAPPMTVTATGSARSPGGLHDYFSEGDYWWPDPADPAGPYVHRDGFSNPATFQGHRRALVRLSVTVATLAVAWAMTRRREYAQAAADHLRAWFLDPETLMNPQLRFAQAISGVCTGRGIIDTVHLAEVALAFEALRGSGALQPGEEAGVEGWFRDYLAWIRESDYGREERQAANNHGTCWVLQAAAFARCTRDADVLAECRDRYRARLLPGQMAPDGSFPLELARTRPYAYSLFNLDAMAGVCQLLSTASDDLFRHVLPDGRGMGRAMGRMAPFIADRSGWPHTPDVEHFDEWPVRHPSLAFAGIALSRQELVELWLRLRPAPSEGEIARNNPIRQPLLWLGRGPR